MSIASAISTGIHAAAAVGGTAYDYLTPGTGSSRVTDYGLGSNGKVTTVAKPPTTAAPATSTTAGPDLASIYNNAYAAALAASQAKVPRLVTMDTSGAWNQARNMATAAVSPIYQQKMTDFLNAQQVALARQQADTTTGKATLDQTLARNLADTQTQRQRTSEDTATNIQDINATQDYNERTGGLSYDAAQRALTEGLGAAGTAESGIGQGQVTDAKIANNMQSNEQVRQSTNKVEAANTLMNRTFTDLGTSDTRNTEDTTSQKGALDLNLERFIEDQGTSLDQEQKQEELDKQSDIASQSITDEGQLVDQWLASLAGKGYTAQEIANAASIYK